MSTTGAINPQSGDLAAGSGMPAEFQPARLRRNAVVVLVALAVLVLIALLAPGLSDVRDILADASPGWLALAVALEVASSLSYVLMFRPVFCNRMPWRRSLQIGLSELAAGSIVPASGAGGLALGAWVLRRGGMPADHIARRSVAFFLIKSSVNFLAVAVIGAAMALDLIGPPVSLWLTAFLAAAASLSIGVVLLVPRLGPGESPGPEAGRLRRALSATRRSLIGGTAEAVELVRSRNPTLLAGAIGYWAFDNAVLLATYKAIGHTLPLSIVLMGYLIGQLGGLLPLPGGVGGIDGGLIGVLVLYGAPVAPTVAAVLAYRLILFWVPLIMGAPAFVTLWRRLVRPKPPEVAVGASGGPG
jgi:uncharacterized membrane protein YbhN (UPF0104 family)